jgi:hypothetical protein
MQSWPISILFWHSPEETEPNHDKYQSLPKIEAGTSRKHVYSFTDKNLVGNLSEDLFNDALSSIY